MAKVIIQKDLDPENPRKWDNLGTMVCSHRSYNLGDEKGLDKLIKEIRSHKKYRVQMEYDYDFSDAKTMHDLAEKLGVFGVVLPLYLYDHSGIAMNTTGFSCRWDSGQVGFIYITKEEMRNEYSFKRISQKLIERVSNYLVGEVETYNQYLNDDVYGFIVENDNEEEIDSCWGFYGSNVEKNGMLEHISEEYHDLAKKAEITLS